MRYLAVLILLSVMLIYGASVALAQNVVELIDQEVLTDTLDGSAGSWGSYNSNLVHISGDVYAFCGRHYGGVNNGGYIFTIEVTSGGTIVGLIDSWNYDSATDYSYQLLCPVAGDIYLVAHESHTANTSLYLKTLEIAADGGINKSIIHSKTWATLTSSTPASLEFITPAGAGHDNIIMMLRGTNGAPDYTIIETLEVANDGTIGAQVDSDNAGSDDILIFRANATYLGSSTSTQVGRWITYANDGLGNILWLKTWDIDNAGNITLESAHSLAGSNSYTVDNGFVNIFDHSSSEEYYAYMDNTNYINTVEINTSGSITVPLIDTYQFTADVVAPAAAFDVYDGKYMGWMGETSGTMHAYLMELAYNGNHGAPQFLGDNAVYNFPGSEDVLDIIELHSNNGYQFVGITESSSLELYLFTFEAILPPQVNTDSISFSHDGAFTPIGSIDFLGNTTVTEYGFVYNTTGYPTVAAGSKSSIVGTGSVGSFSWEISGLSNSQLYYVRAFATNSIGTGYGEQLLTFTGPNYANNLLDLTFEPLTISGTRIDDQSGSANHVYYTLAPNPGSVSITISTVSSTNLAEFTALTDTPYELLPVSPGTPANWYINNGSYDAGLPGQSLTNEILTAGGIPLKLFWVPFVYLIILGLAFTVGIKSKSHLALVWLVCNAGVWAGAGFELVDAWFVPVYLLISTGLLISEREVRLV